MGLAFAEKGEGRKKNVRSGGLGDLTRLLGEAGGSGSGNSNDSGSGTVRGSRPGGQTRKR
jgi:SWI/SNF-related matrix-associated actin-dependent regulator of chromatin subfamily A3